MIKRHVALQFVIQEPWQILLYEPLNDQSIPAAARKLRLETTPDQPLGVTEIVAPVLLHECRKIITERKFQVALYTFTNRN